ncbi:MAG: ATP-binding protein [Pseudomonadota bacterium]
MIFLGGVHGVGKTSMCSGVVEKFGLKVVGASAIIRAEREYPSSDTRTAVANVGSNQDLLIRGMQRLITDAPGRYVMDGHFALRTLAGSIEEIDADVFRAIEVSGFICLFDDPAAIAQRLAARDGVVPEVSAIAELQSAELRSAELVSRTLGLGLKVVQAFDTRAFEDSLRTC